MKRNGFTLLELLVVIGLMGYMGTIAVGGYRAMRRGMEERSVLQNVSQFIRSAYQRAQIDRTPVHVYFWNETLREETTDTPIQVVGRAVAVRRSGRFTSVSGNDLLIDEFSDLKSLSGETDDDDSSSSSSSGSQMGRFLYKMNGDETSSGTIPRSTISETTVKTTSSELLLSKGNSVTFTDYAYKVIDAGGVSWKAGMAYGFEFADIQLPHGYLFGSTYSKSTSSPISGESGMHFTISSTGSASYDKGGTVDVYSLRPGSSGSITAQKVGSSDKPDSDLD